MPLDSLDFHMHSSPCLCKPLGPDKFGMGCVCLCLSSLFMHLQCVYFYVRVTYGYACFRCVSKPKQWLVIHSFIYVNCWSLTVWSFTTVKWIDNCRCLNSCVDLLVPCKQIMLPCSIYSQVFSVTCFFAHPQLMCS